MSYSTGWIKKAQSRRTLFLPSGLWILYKDVMPNQEQPSYSQEGISRFTEAVRMERWKEPEFLMIRLKSRLHPLSVCHLWAWCLSTSQFPQLSNRSDNSLFNRHAVRIICNNTRRAPYTCSAAVYTFWETRLYNDMLFSYILSHLDVNDYIRCHILL